MIALRRAGSGDVDFLVGLATDAEIEPFIGVRAPRDADAVRVELALDAEAPAERGWFVIESNGEPVGAVAFRTENVRSRIAHVHRLAVRPAARGRGIASDALSHLSRHLIQQLGFHRIEAETYGFNERAQRVFERAGFTREGVRRLAYLRNDSWNDAVAFGLVAEDMDASLQSDDV